MAGWRAGWLVAACVVCAGCATRGHYVWVDEYRPATGFEDRAYVILPGDQLSVRVLNHDEVSGRVKVRTDGRISLPLLNDCDAAGASPSQLSDQLTKKFQSYIRNPVVTVTLEEARPFTVSVVGEVMRPGVYVVEPDSGVLHALANAGGLSQYAHEDRIFVIRSDGTGRPPTRIRFEYDALSRAEGQSGTFRLSRNDVVVVE